jgi:hypothetical protein
MKDQEKKPPEDITGKKLPEEELDRVSGGLRKASDCSYMCGTNPNSKGTYVDAG